jgi:chromosome segregation ATPase
MRLNSLFYLVVLAAGCLVFNGCNEELSSDQIRMAQLVGNENLELKKQLKDKDGRIAELTKQLEQAKEESQQAIGKAQQQIKDRDGRIAELTKQSRQNTLVITQMQEASVQMQKHFDATLAEHKQRLENYEKAASAASIPCPEVEKQYAALYNELMGQLSECREKLEKYEPAAADVNQIDK